jgi:hypothetical protein
MVKNIISLLQIGINLLMKGKDIAYSLSKDILSIKVSYKIIKQMELEDKFLKTTV